MDSTTTADSALTLVRRSLEGVKGGDEVLEYIQRLTTERDDLLKRQEHLTSLARLMEKTVADADDMAAQIKGEAERAAQEHGQQLVTEAEDKARQILEEASSKAVAEAENDVRMMKENAQKALEGVLGEHKARLQEQVKQAAGRLYEQMLAQAEETKRQLEAFQGELDNLVGSAPAIADQASPAPVEAGQIAEAKSVVEPLEPEAAGTPEPEPAAEPVRYAKGEEELVDIVILPPRDKGAMESIRKFLERQEEVAAVNVEHMTDRTLIQVLLAEPLNVAERLTGLSEVERLQTISDGNKTKIQVVLSVHSEIERERDRLDFRANRIASKIRAGSD